MSVILIADDNPHAHRMGGQILSQEGHDVVTVANGDEAMQYLAENKPDLVMADTRMPGPDGFDLCRHIRANESFADTKVVLLAGPLEPFDPAQAESAGCDTVLHKPLDAYSLIETVNSLIGKAEAAHDSAEPAAPSAASADAPATDHEAEALEVAEEALAAARDEAATTEADGSETADAPPSSATSAADAVEKAEAEDDDPFAAVVTQALSVDAPNPEERAQRVRQAVAEAIEASIPDLIDSVTTRVLERIQPQEQ